jgi:predicted transcriptional regulator
MEGWVKIHRKMLEWQWMNKPEMVSLFVYCLLKANHNGAMWQGKKIERGQFITSPERISHALGISYQTVRTSLTRLENTGEINKQTTNKYTIITVCNYDSYQQEQQTNNTELTNNQQTTNKQLTTNKNDKKKKNIDTIRIFYDSELEKTTDEFYHNFVKFIYGNNPLKKPLDKVLKTPEQISYDNFCSLMAIAKEKNRKLLDTILDYENYKGKEYKSVYLTVRNWLKK